MNQSTDFTLVSYCVTRHLDRSERAAMAKRCLAAVCFALRLLRPSLVVMGIDPTFPPPARRTLQKSATIVLIRKSLLGDCECSSVFIEGFLESFDFCS